MDPRAVVGAVLVALATAMSAHARTEPLGGGPSHRGVTRQPVEGTAPGEASEPAKTQAAASAGGAIYIPFSDAPGHTRPKEATADPRSNADPAGMGLTVAVALAGVALCGYVLRRAMRGL